MLLNNIFSTAVAVGAILVPMAQANEDLEARSQDITVKWHSKTTCKDSGGPKRTYSSGPCLGLSDTDHGVEIIDRHGACHRK